MDISAVSSNTQVNATQGIDANDTKNSIVNEIMGNNNNNNNNNPFGPGDAFLKDVLNAFKNMGIDLQQTLQTGDNTSDSESDPNQTLSDVGGNLKTFLSSLKQSLALSSINELDQSLADTSGSSILSSINGLQNNGYSNLTGDLTSLIDSLGNNGDSSQSSLLASFNQVMQNAGFAASPASSSDSTSVADLQGFLNTMLNNVQNRASEQNSTGSLISTRA